MTIKEHFKKLVGYMSQGIFEKDQIMAIALLCMAANESVFLLGPPGTAKSLVARRLKMIMKDARAFEYLMSRFSTPDEIFGPVSISKLKNEDRYERIVDGYLPSAEIVFLDEIWKAGPSIQNSLLTAINERIFTNGSQTVKLPMRLLIAASNELPAEDEGLEALWDRFLVRLISNCIQSERSFIKMVRQSSPETVEVPDKDKITLKTLEEWRYMIDDIEIPDEVCAVVTAIRKQLKEALKREGVTPMDYYISDRRWKKIFNLLRMSARVNSRQAVDFSDCLLIMHCLWNKAEIIPEAITMVINALTMPIDSKFAKIQKDLDECQKSFNEANGMTSEQQEAIEKSFQVVQFFYYVVQGHASGKCLFSSLDYKQLPMDKDSVGLMYYDDQKQANIIHVAFENVNSLNRLARGAKSNAQVTKVKLKKFIGGVLIDDKFYKFQRSNLANMGKAPLPNPQFGCLHGKMESFTPALEECAAGIESLRNSIIDGDNLFISADDVKLIKKQIERLEKELSTTTIKLQTITTRI